MKSALLATLQSSCAGTVCFLQNFSSHHYLKFQAGSLKSLRFVFCRLTHHFKVADFEPAFPSFITCLTLDKSQ